MISFIKDIFRKGDVDGDGRLNLKEIVALMKQFNYSVDKENAEILFNVSSFVLLFRYLE